MTENPRLKLTYFDFDGGRGEPARLALSIGGIEFDDDRVQFPAWTDRKATTPLGELPLLSVGEQTVCQSNAINRYVGRLTGLYPTDSFQALLADEASDVVEAFYAELGPSFRITDLPERTAARAKLLEGKGGLHLRALAGMLERSGGEWFADRRLTVADLKVAGMMRHLSSGILDGIPKDHVANTAPVLSQHQQRVADHPGVSSYYAKRAKK